MKEIEEDDDKTSSFIDINLDSISESMERVNPDKLYILRFDGASSRGNPGAAAGSGFLSEVSIGLRSGVVGSNKG